MSKLLGSVILAVAFAAACNPENANEHKGVGQTTVTGAPTPAPWTSSSALAAPTHQPETAPSPAGIRREVPGTVIGASGTNVTGPYGMPPKSGVTGQGIPGTGMKLDGGSMQRPAGTDVRDGGVTFDTGRHGAGAEARDGGVNIQIAPR